MKSIEVSSAQNAQFKIWKSLLSSKGIKEHHQFLLMGEKLITEFVTQITAQSFFQIEGLIRTHKHIAPAVLGQKKINTKEALLSPELFQELDVLGTHFPLLLVSFQNLPLKQIDQQPQGLEIVCPLGDPRNLGALTRSAAGFGVKEIILTQEACHPFLPQAIKSSAGAVLSMGFALFPQKISEMPLIGANFALELHGEKIHQVKWPSHLRLWVGEEGPGLRLEHLQKRTMKFIHIPTQGIESLNATVSTSIAIWEWSKSQLN
jgi:TrmH family RNA methyltransferase